MNKTIMLSNFTDLTLDEKKMILSWRNNPTVKKWMYTQDDISLENHLKFIEQLLGKKDKVYFLVKQHSQNIGIIDFNNITLDRVDMGIYTNPDKKGVGKILLETIIDYSFEVLKVKTIYAEVFAENNKAHGLYKKYSFEEVNRKEVINKEVICMELKNENR